MNACCRPFNWYCERFLIFTRRDLIEEFESFSGWKHSSHFADKQKQQQQADRGCVRLSREWRRWQRAISCSGLSWGARWHFNSLWSTRELGEVCVCVCKHMTSPVTICLCICLFARQCRCHRVCLWEHICVSLCVRLCVCVGVLCRCVCV